MQTSKVRHRCCNRKRVHVGFSLLLAQQESHVLDPRRAHAQVAPLEIARAKLAVWPHSMDMMFICKQLGAFPPSFVGDVATAICTYDAR